MSQTDPPPDFNVTPGSVTKGARVTFNVTNDGSLPHRFIVVPSRASKSPEYVRVSLNFGENGVGTMTVPDVSSLYYYCDVQGHEAAGMKGTLTVN